MSFALYHSATILLFLLLAILSLLFTLPSGYSLTLVVPVGTGPLVRFGFLIKLSILISLILF